jgi:D-alanine-D-alanine ligase
MEVNPLAGLHPEHSDLPIICTMVGVTFEQLIGKILASARERAGI